MFCLRLIMALKNRSEEKYPVVYLLHGFTDDYQAWAKKGQMQQVVDELIDNGIELFRFNE